METPSFRVPRLRLRYAIGRPPEGTAAQLTLQMGEYFSFQKYVSWKKRHFRAPCQEVWMPPQSQGCRHELPWVTGRKNSTHGCASIPHIAFINSISCFRTGA